MKIFYHDDLDGKCAANLAYMALTPKRPSITRGKIAEKDLISADYKEKIDLSVVKKGERVVIVDYHIEPSEMKELIEKVGAENVVWIDHHKSSIEKYEKSDVDISGIGGIRDTRYCGAYLTYFWLGNRQHGSKGNPAFAYSDAPRYIQLIDDWDTFKWHDKGNVDAYHFMLACNMCRLHPAADNAWASVRNNVRRYIEMGQIIAEYKVEYAAEVIKRTGFATKLDGVKAYASNFPFCSSVDFESVKEAQECDMIIAFYQNGSDGRYSVSLYAVNNDVDCARIAQKYGGGGHKGASGFSCDELPFKRP